MEIIAQNRPKRTKSFEHAKIYKIWNDVDDEIYVGKTCKPYLSQRFSKHRKALKEYINGKCNMKIYQHMYNIGFEHFHIELLEELKDCKTCEEYNKAEGKWMRELKSTLNTNMAGTTRQEVDKNKYHKYKSRILEERKIYYEKNKDKINSRTSLWYLKNKDRINEQRRLKRKQQSIIQSQAEHTSCDGIDTVNQACSQSL